VSASLAVFLVLALLAVLGAVGVVFLDNPVRAAIALVLNFFVLGFIYFMLGSQLLGISQIMVYAGAIMVLFLFVIMMLKLDTSSNKPVSTDSKRLLGIVFGLAMFLCVGAALLLPMKDYVGAGTVGELGTPQAIGKTLFSAYVWPFELASLLLLIGIVGSIMLAKRKF